MRPLDAIERSFNHVYESLAPPGFRSQDVLTTARIEVECNHDVDSFEALARRAWIRMSHVHPAITASFHGDRFIYSIPKDDDEIQKWLATSFVVNETQFNNSGSGNVTACSSTTSYQDLALVPPSPQPVMYYFPHEKTFALRSPHIYTDGTGTLMLLEDFLTELASLLKVGNVKTINMQPLQPADTEIIKNLPESTINAANIPTVGNTEMQSLLSRLDLDFDREAIKLSGLDSRSSASDPGPGRLQVLRLSANETAAIIRSGKETGLGFTALVHAAILHAGQHLSNQPAAGVRNIHTTVTGFTIRDRCTLEPPNAGERAFTTRVSLWPFQVQVGEDILETARTLKADYATLAARKDAILAASVPFVQTLLPSFARSMDASFFASFPGNLMPIILRQYGHVRIQELGLSLITTTPMMLLVVQSFGGQMEIRLTYSAASHGDDEVQRFLQLIKLGLGNISG
jgi:hypothetical protein